MFQVNEYKIVFKRVWHTDDDDGCCYDGRYDTKCEIYVRDKNMIGRGFRKVYHKEPRFTGIARLHPNDKPDKIVGKKIALFRAMGLYWEEVVFYNAFGAEHKRKILYCSNDTFNAKQVRTAIWKNFWKWVASWPVSINLELHNRAFGSTSVKAKVNEEMRRLHKTTEWQPPKSKT